MKHIKKDATNAQLCWLRLKHMLNTRNPVAQFGVDRQRGFAGLLVPVLLRGLGCPVFDSNQLTVAWCYRFSTLPCRPTGFQPYDELELDIVRVAIELLIDCVLAGSENWSYRVFGEDMKDLLS